MELYKKKTKDSLRKTGPGNGIKMGLKWYGLVGLNYVMVYQLFILFLDCPFNIILNFTLLAV
jgi:hypothetical protein